jgi:hypothetical protein
MNSKPEGRNILQHGESRAGNGGPMAEVEEVGEEDSSVRSTVELHLSGLIVTASHPDMQKIRLIGFLFENNLHWQFEVR